MSPQAQQMAIANWCHDHSRDVTTHWHDGDYLTNLNDMHEAEKAAFPDFESSQRYYASLCGVTQGMGCFQAAANQRAEALLRTLNLWDDSK